MKRYIPARLILFPGLGADPRLFEKQKRLFGNDLECPAWLAPQRDEPFDSYAHRWAQRLEPQQSDRRPLLLGGVSFGGLVAMQMAKHLRPRAVILIGSCRSKHAKPRGWSVARRLGDMIPRRLFGSAAMALAARGVALFDGLDDTHRALLIKMAGQSDPDRVRWGGHACADWDFSAHHEPGFPPIHQIHGRHDPIIPLHDGDPDVVIPDGRHLINLSHPTTVNRFIMDVVRRYADARPESRRPLG